MSRPSPGALWLVSNLDMTLTALEKVYREISDLPALDRKPKSGSAAYGVGATSRDHFRFANARNFPSSVLGPVDRPPWTRQRPLRGRLFSLSHTGRARHA